MKIIIQRVRKASVCVQGKAVGSINNGLLLLVGIKKGDTKKQAQWLAEKAVSLRIFDDEDGKMNTSLDDVKGSLLVVPNFTLYADTASGNRPGFGAAEAPGKAKKMFENLVEMLRKSINQPVETGRFGANMDVELINDGPVTIILEK